MFPLFLALTLGCGGAEEPAAPAASPEAEATAEAEAGKIRNIDVDTLAADLEAGKVAVLVDVRTASEFASGHVPGAINIPVSEIEGRKAELEAHKDAELYMVCQSGGRSARAASAMAEHGFDTVNVEGGTSAWIASGRETE